MKMWFLRHSMLKCRLLVNENCDIPDILFILSTLAVKVLLYLPLRLSRIQHTLTTAIEKKY
jgi:hypothetical protein